MKKISFTLCSLLLGSSIGLATLGHAKAANGSGYVFAGGQLGLGGFFGIFEFTLGGLGGYHWYFPDSWQFSSFRHGIRGYGALDWAYISRHIAAVRVGADWTIDFTPTGRYVWGAFGGFSIGGVFGGYNGFAWTGNMGASLEMLSKHRFELAYKVDGLNLPYSLLNIRYIYKF